MKTVQINIYKFSELPEDIKQKVLVKLEDINTSFSWWDFVYEDAVIIGLKLKGFSLDVGSIEGEFIESACDCAEQIIKNHGDTCETCKNARKFIVEYDRLVEKYSDGVDKDRVAFENELPYDEEVEKIEDEFLNTICKDYLIMLKKEYSYEISDEAIVETIESNDYDFTKHGEIYTEE